MAAPQGDGYDSDVLAVLALERYGWAKRNPTSDAVTWLEGTVTLRRPDDSIAGGNNQPADTDHPNIAQAEIWFRDAWPAMYQQAQRLLQTLYVYLDPRTGEQTDQTGCSCGPLFDRVSMEISTTINGAIGLLEGVVHEMAHNKLKYMGVSMYHWERLVTNGQPTPEAIESGEGAFLYESPIRKDKLRPIGACYSAHYSYLHVAELLRGLNRRGIFNGEMFDRWYGLQVKRLREGEKQVETVIEKTTEGEVFFAASSAWARDLMAFGA